MKGLQFQKLNEKAVLPSRGSIESAGLDIHSVEETTVKPGERRAIQTGLAVSIPQGCYGRMAPRSGLAFKYGVDVLAGVIDSDYRGEIKCLLINLGSDSVDIKEGDRIAQLLIEKVDILVPEWTAELTSTSRGEGGFGSTGK